MVEARAGETIGIGADVPHQALGLGDATAAVNFYFKESVARWEVAVVAPDRFAGGRRDFAHLVGVRPASGAAGPGAGMARESFSRRCFRHVLGVPPQVFRVSARLNVAWSALRAGAPQAEKPRKRNRLLVNVGRRTI